MLEPQWGHGDWHPSNLAWSSRDADASVVSVVRPRPCRIAIVLRCTISPLRSSGARSTGSTWPIVARSPSTSTPWAALLDGYIGRDSGCVRLRRAGTGSPALLPVVHIEHGASLKSSTTRASSTTLTTRCSPTTAISSATPAGSEKAPASASSIGPSGEVRDLDRGAVALSGPARGSKRGDPSTSPTAARCGSESTQVFVVRQQQDARPRAGWRTTAS